MGYSKRGSYRIGSHVAGTLSAGAMNNIRKKLSKFKYDGKAHKKMHSIKQKVKMGHSVTRTKTKTERKTISGDDLHSGTGKSYLSVFVRKPLKGVSKRQAHLKYTWDVNSIVSGAAGAQAVDEPVALGTINQWLTSSGTAYVGVSSYTRWLDLNPSQKISGSATITAGTPLTDRLVLKSAFVDSNFTNLENVEQDVVVYWLCAKQNNTSSPFTSWSQSLVAEGLGQPIITQVGAGVKSSGTLGYSNFNFSHSGPRGSLFHREWVIKKVRAFKMAAASTYQLKTKLELNQLANAEYFSALSAQGIVYPKGCVTMIMTVNGQLIHDVTAAPNCMTYASTSIGYLHKCYLYFGTYQQNAQRVNMELDVTAVAFNTGAANQKAINIVDVADTTRNA